MLHERLKMLRKALNIGSQQKFANDLGISFSNVSSYEMGRRTPSDAVIKLICEKYNVREEWLRDGEGEMFRDVDVDFGTICAEIGIEDLKANFFGSSWIAFRNKRSRGQFPCFLFSAYNLFTKP